MREHKLANICGNLNATKLIKTIITWMHCLMIWTVRTWILCAQWHTSAATATDSWSLCCFHHFLVFWSSILKPNFHLQEKKNRNKKWLKKVDAKKCKNVKIKGKSMEKILHCSFFFEKISLNHLFMYSFCSAKAATIARIRHPIERWKKTKRKNRYA